MVMLRVAIKESWAKLQPHEFLRATQSLGEVCLGVMERIMVFLVAVELHRGCVERLRG